MAQVAVTEPRLVVGANGITVDLHNLPAQPSLEQMQALAGYVAALEQALATKQEIAPGNGEEADAIIDAPAETRPSRKRKALTKFDDSDEEDKMEQEGEEDYEEVAEKRPKKKAKNAEGAASLIPATTMTASSKVTQKVMKAKLKTLIAHLKAKVKSEKFFSGWHGTVREFAAEEIFTQEEFKSVFQNYGTQTQPTPTNLPKSTVIIRELTRADLVNIFGEETLSGLKCNLWKKGGIPTGGGFGGFFGRRGGGGFSKGSKIGSVPLLISSAKLNYSTNNLKVTLRFSCTSGSESGGSDDSDLW